MAKAKTSTENEIQENAHKKAKFVTLFYNKPNQHTYIGHRWNIDENGKTGTLNANGKPYAKDPNAILGKNERNNHGSIVRLRPGANVVMLDTWESMQADDAIKDMIESGTLKLFDPNMKGNPEAETAGELDDLEPLSDKDAIILINETMDIDKLKDFKKNLGKGRSKVENALETQIEKVETTGVPAKA